jgi:hypothetical protein
MTAVLPMNPDAAPREASTPSNARTGDGPRFGSVTVLFLCTALLAGPAYDSYLHYDFTHSTDSLSYMSMAEGNFDVVVTHRYRVVVPLLSKAVSLPVSMIYGTIWPHRDDAIFHLRFGFFVVNLACMSLVGLMLFRTCQAYGLSLTACCVGVVGVMVSRWSNCLASLPLVDAFHLLCVCLVFFALKSKSGRLLALAILLGPLAKESFVFIAPVTLLFGNLRVWVQLVLYTVAGLLVLAVHLLVDANFPAADVGSVQNAVHHFQNIPIALTRFASPGGLGEVFTVLGLFNFVWLASLLKPARAKLLMTIDLPLWLLLGACVLQALISTSLARMLFVAAPFWAVLLGKGAQLLLESSAWPKQEETTASAAREAYAEWLRKSARHAA